MKIQTSAMLYNDKYQINDIEPISLIEYVVNLCKDISTKKPTSVATDDEKTSHKVWVVSDEKIVKEVENCLKDKKTFIADGHHRYETSWNYLQYIKGKDSNFSDTKEYGYVLAFLCPNFLRSTILLSRVKKSKSLKANL